MVRIYQIGKRLKKFKGIFIKLPNMIFNSKSGGDFMKSKLFLFFTAVLLASQSSALTPEIHVEGKKELTVYNREGEAVHSIPLEPKDLQAKTEEASPAIERTSQALVVDGEGNVLDKISLEKNIRDDAFHTAAIGARVATVAIAADEEFRSANSNWTSTAATLVEEMDDAFNRDHNFDLDIKLYISWSSQGSSPEQLLDDLRKDWASKYNYDFLIGFSNDSHILSVGGIAYVYSSNPSTMAVSLVNGTQSYKGIWHAGQHELSHNFGAGHHSSSDYTKCIMNYHYAYTVDYWDSTHGSIIARNKSWFGKAY